MMVRRMAEWKDSAFPGVISRDISMKGGRGPMDVLVQLRSLVENTGIVFTVVKWFHDWIRDAALSAAKIGVDGSTSRSVASWPIKALDMYLK